MVSTNVVIVGGGPGGSATAIYLARKGIKSVIIEKQVMPRYHIGESMTGECGQRVRDLGLGGLFAEDLITYYPDIAGSASACRFRDCTHSHEPDCAVKAAVAGGNLAGWRLDNYVKLYVELG